MYSLLFACVLLLVTAMPAAAKVFPIRTTITEVNASELAVAPGDVFGGSAVFDPADLPVDGFLPVDVAGRDLVLDFGDFTVNAADAEGFGTGFPAFYVEAGQIVGLDLSASVSAAFFQPLDFEGGVFDDSFTFLDPVSGATVVAGTLEVIPLPGALPLLATGIAGLLWITRRRGHRPS